MRFRKRHNYVNSTMADRVLWGWETFFEEIVSFLSLARSNLGVVDQRRSQHILERLETCLINIAALRDHLQHPPREWLEDRQPTDTEIEVLFRYATQLQELLECLRGIANLWQVHLDELESNLSASTTSSYQAPVEDASGPGRPRFSITREQLQYLSSMSFSWTQIADILGVSRMTIYRRRVEFGLVHTANRTMTDSELRRTLRQIRSELPELGETMVWGQLRAMGYNIPRRRVRHAIRATDPFHTALRWRGQLTSRRPYAVPGPNSLWHIGELICMHVAHFMLVTFLLFLNFLVHRWPP